MENFVKILRIALTCENGNLFVKVEFKDGRLSITGVEGPMSNGACHGSCGQIVMRDWDIDQYADGWDDPTVAKLREVWDRWHLNDLTAGSPAQEQYLRDNPVKAVYPESDYTKASEALAAVGLNPDPDYLHNGQPYKYGSAWLFEAVPDDVLEWLRSLPDADKTPAWI